MVGASVCAWMAAPEANSVNACAFPVEKVAAPFSSFAVCVPSVSLISALLALRRSSRALPARICALPWGSVLRQSPPYTVVPTSAFASPTWARSAVITVPSAAEGPPQVGMVTRLKKKAVEEMTPRARIWSLPPQP